MYAELNSPLPNLTVSPTGDHCCGFRGFLGQDPGSVDYTEILSYPDPSAVDLSNLPLAPANTAETLSPLISPPVSMIDFPVTIGTEFTSNGDGTYTNIQTGQSVPYAYAQQITAATTGVATSNLQTQGTEVAGSIVDPNTGATIPTNNLTAAAQALNAAGQLVNAAGKLTAQGQTLLNAGNLYNAPPSTAGANLSAAMSSLTSWFTGSTMIAGVPNIAILGLGVLAVVILPSMLSKKGKRR
jgi:adhesin HecA-like repeat protein